MKKFAYILILAVIVVTGCASTLQKQSKDITIEYQAMTRGANRQVVVKEGKVETKDVRAEKESVTATITAEQWNDLLEEVEKINLNKIADLQAPTNKRMFDGALIATLSVRLKDTIYKSSSFDHGQPPAEIATLVNKVIAMSALDKQKQNDN